MTSWQEVNKFNATASVSKPIGLTSLTNTSVSREPKFQNTFYTTAKKPLCSVPIGRRPVEAFPELDGEIT